MHGIIEQRRNLKTLPLCTVTKAGLKPLRKSLGAAQQRWLDASGFDASPGSFVLLPRSDGRVTRVIAGVDPLEPVWALGTLPGALPPGNYALEPESQGGGFVPQPPALAALGWALGAYRYTRYRTATGRHAPAQLAVPREEYRALQPIIDAICRVRDLVNTPSEDMGPEQLAGTIKTLGKSHNARVREWVGDALLKDNFPTIHAVGRASHRPPRLVELRWGDERHPRLTLVGKGVCFDSGGLNLKSGNGMRWMKKDMGGAAHAIGLAELVMRAELPVHLTLLVPTVENSVAGNAVRPGEVIRTRSGMTVEVDNTDAEGRLILCDALAYAGEHKPDLLIDFATLTGAARVALGPDLPALFANRDENAEALLAASEASHDPLWRMPLWQPYRGMLDSYIADTANSSNSRHAGAITAALYLQRFVPERTPWIHVDVFAWNDSDRPGRPRGGEAQGLRAFFNFLNARYRD